MVANRIFVSNLPWTVGPQQLRNVFSKYGGIKYSEVKFDWKTGISKGYGFVEFFNKEAYTKVLNNYTEEIFTNTLLRMAEVYMRNPEDLQVLFNDASTYVRSIISKLTNQQMLEFYGLFKQATEGPCLKPKPGWHQFSEKQKWEAWSSLKNMDSSKAMEKYIALLNSIEPLWKEKPVENLNGWIHHSCLRNDDEVIKDSNKTIFDWVKEKNFAQVKECSSSFTLDINKLDESGLSLLHWASDRGSLEIVKYLVEQLHADVNVKDSNGQTPLHYAVSCEYEDVSKYLVEAGADVNLMDNDGQTPYDTIQNQ